MSDSILGFCMGLAAAHARLRRKLDDQLGSLHGMSLSDFVLLQALSQARDGRLHASQLAVPLGVQPSAVVRQVIALEKTGWVQRETDASGRRTVVLRGSGRRLLHEAAETAAVTCTAALQGAAAGELAAADAVFERLVQASALEPG